MALSTDITEIPFQTGQDEGTAVEVLPAGTFSRLQNARYRKVNQIGKRNGYDSKTSLDAGGAPLGNGGGRLSTLGPGFAVVDDRFYRRDTVADTWATPTAPNDRVLANRFPEFMPAPILETTTQESLAAAEPGEGGMTFALGYVWTAEARALNGAGWVVHVDARDPNTGDVIFTKEITLTSITNTDEPHVQMLTTLSGKVVLITDRFTAGTKTSASIFHVRSVGSERPFPAVIPRSHRVRLGADRDTELGQHRIP
jgi:hypothetical protein